MASLLRKGQPFTDAIDSVNVVPKRNNTECAHQYTKNCGMNCPSHRTGFMGILSIYRVALGIIRFYLTKDTIFILALMQCSYSISDTTGSRQVPQ